MVNPGHGNGAGVPRVEVPPPDELSYGVQAPEQADAGRERRANGTWVRGAKQDQSKGGKTRAGTIRLANGLGLGPLVTLEAFRPFLEMAEDFRRTHSLNVAMHVGGGECGTGPSSLIASAALQLAASRYWYARGAEAADADLFTLASKLANDSRQNLLAAHELAVRECKSRGAKTSGAERSAAALAALNAGVPR